MSTSTMTRIAPIAAALVIAYGLAGCNRANENAEVPPAAATAAAPMPETMPPASTTSSMPSESTTMPPAASTVGGATSGMASDMGATSGPISDTDFYQHALSGGEKEIAASKMAEKSSNADVKALAKTVIADHTALGEKVKAAAGANAPTPATPDTSELAGKSGADLDKAYVDMMLADHQKDIPMFENASKNASTDQAKQLASAAVPKLKKHLDMAQKAQASLMK